MAKPKKLESLPIKTLVEGFINKWKLTKLTVEEKSTETQLRDLGGSVQATNIPVVIEYLNGGRTYYYITWKCHLLDCPYIDRLKKEDVLHPQHHFEAFKLKQLEEAEEWQSKNQNVR